MATTVNTPRTPATRDLNRPNQHPERDDNADPITGEPGAHPVGTGLGTVVGGAAAGVGAGALGGPIGAAVGAVVGGVIGGFAGKEIAEEIDPTVEEHYWRHEYVNRDYYDDNVAYGTVKPAYQFGWEARCRHVGRSWDDAEADVRREWEASKHSKSMSWDRAQGPIHDAWDRVECIVAKSP